MEPEVAKPKVARANARGTSQSDRPLQRSKIIDHAQRGQQFLVRYMEEQRLFREWKDSIASVTCILEVFIFIPDQDTNK